MRLLNIVAALSGLLALAMLVYAAHSVRAATAEGELAIAIERIKIGAFIQMGAAAAGLAIANRSGRVNALSGALILAGAALFAGTMYGIALIDGFALTMFAPIGGVTLLAGWAVLAFTKPGN
jgi:uncharacterized membrane protein YgdD (TMEM256/DUF423 family)